MFLEMKWQIWNIDWPNQAQRDFVNRQEVVEIKRIEPRSREPYCVILMSEGLEVTVANSVYTNAVNLGIEVQTIKRLQ